MDRIPVRMQRVSTAVDEDEKRKEEHEKQYEEVEKVIQKQINSHHTRWFSTTNDPLICV